MQPTRTALGIVVVAATTLGTAWQVGALVPPGRRAEVAARPASPTGDASPTSQTVTLPPVTATETATVTVTCVPDFGARMRARVEHVDATCRDDLDSPVDTAPTSQHDITGGAR